MNEFERKTKRERESGLVFLLGLAWLGSGMEQKTVRRRDGRTGLEGGREVSTVNGGPLFKLN